MQKEVGIRMSKSISNCLSVYQHPRTAFVGSIEALNDFESLQIDGLLSANF